MHEELENEVSPRRNTWRGRFPMPVGSFYGFGVELGWGIWRLGLGGEVGQGEGVRGREETGRE